ncbi:MAG: hypothetical protein ACK5ZZ_12050 [Gemmatimonadaceae bacterium]
MTRSHVSAGTLVLALSLSVVACGDDTEVIIADSAAAASTAANAPASGPVIATPSAAAPASELPPAVIQKARNNQSADFLSLFEAPAQVVRLQGITSLPLWDLIGVAKNATEDPKGLLDEGMMQWMQIEGPTVTINNPGKMSATAVLPASPTEQTYGFRINITNASGGRSMDVRVAVAPR